ncbi:MAG: hypothetical protein M3Q73_00510 [bacterium]|nr:hypothetical protein [bacterium]
MYHHYTLSKTKIFLTTLLIVGTIVAYDHMVHRVSAQNEIAVDAAGEALQIVNTIEAINLDTTIVTEGVFTSLEDFSKEIETESVGRTNPFAPLSGSARAQTRGR